jgi:hypothetical protein
MARAIGLMNPDNAVKSTGAFKEGVIRIDSNSYKVHKAQVGEGQPDNLPSTKWSWIVTRMNEQGNEPLTDDNGESIKEELLFSFGMKSLPFVHPGRMDGPEDDPEDLGTSIGAEGNTIYLNAVDWKPNEKSGLVVLTASLAKLNVSRTFIDRCWTPDWNGFIFHVASQEGPKSNDGRVFSYKVATKLISAPSAKRTSKSANGAAAGQDAGALLAPIISRLSTELAGQTITKKAFANRVKSVCDTSNVPNHMLVPVLTLVRNEKWLQEVGETFDFTVTNDGITFGSIVP